MTSYLIGTGAKAAECESLIGNEGLDNIHEILDTVETYLDDSTTGVAY